MGGKFIIQKASQLLDGSEIPNNNHRVVWMYGKKTINNWISTTHLVQPLDF